MTTLTFLFIFVPILAGILLALNYILAVHKPDIEKMSPFECGFQSFSQTRSPFSISFYLVGILFLVFDLEIVLLYPYIVSAYNNGIYGLWIFIIFLIILTVGFVYELGKGALKIYSRQTKAISEENF